MRNFKTLLIVFICLLFSKENKPHYFKENKGTFLENVASDDPKVQRKIEILKDQFEVERLAINKFYKKKHESLKEQKKTEIKQLKKQYKKRVKRLKVVKHKMEVKKDKMKQLNGLNKQPVIKSNENQNTSLYKLKPKTSNVENNNSNTKKVILKKK